MVVAVISSVIAFFSLWVSWSANKKTEKLNKLYLEKTEMEIKKEKSADLQIKLVESNKGFHYLKLENKGKCKAENIKIKDEGEKQINLQSNSLKHGEESTIGIPADEALSYKSLFVSWKDQLEDHDYEELLVNW